MYKKEIDLISLKDGFMKYNHNLNANQPTKGGKEEEEKNNKTTAKSIISHVTVKRTAYSVQYHLRNMSIKIVIRPIWIAHKNELMKIKEIERQYYLFIHL